MIKPRYFSYAGIVCALLTLLPIIPWQMWYVKELLAALTLALGIVAMWKGDKRWGLVVLIAGIILVVLTLIGETWIYQLLNLTAGQQ